MQQFENQFPGFRAEFGNEQHRYIVEEMGKYYRDRFAYLELKKARKDSPALKKKCIERKKKIREMIKFSEKKTP